MEQISFRTSMTVLAGVVAFAAVVAAVSVLMSQAPGSPRHVALGRPAGASAPAAPTSAPATPSRPAPAAPSSSPARATRPAAHPAATASPPPVAAAESVPSAAPAAAVTAPAVSPPVTRVSYQPASLSVLAAWWAWWLRVHSVSGLRGLSRGGGWPGRR